VHFFFWAANKTPEKKKAGLKALLEFVFTGALPVVFRLSEGVFRP
jgi:hypothetical protein